MNNQYVFFITEGDVTLNGGSLFRNEMLKILQILQ